MCSCKGVFDAAELWSWGAAMSSGPMGRSWPCEVTSRPHSSITCSCDQWETAMSSQAQKQLGCDVCTGWATVCKLLCATKENQYSYSCHMFQCVYSFVCIHSCVCLNSLWNSWREGIREIREGKKHSWALLPPGGSLQKHLWGCK